MRKQGFISHIHEESGIAEYIKNWCNNIFLGQLDLFVSSLDMRPGSWLEHVRHSLRSSAFIFPLLSKNSIGRTWINFESGSAFMASGVQLIPLCHKDLSPSDLTDPYRYFQSYDLRNSNDIKALVQYLSQELALNMPRIDSKEFAQEIIRLDKGLYRLFASFGELKSSEELREALAEIESPTEIPIYEIEIWDELELRVQLHGNRVIEASGYTRDATGFNIYNIDVPKGSTYLLIQFENTENAISHDLDKLLKLVIDRQNIKSYLKGSIHYDDRQFTVKGDGFFVFELPFSVKHVGKIQSINFVFWRIELQRLLVRLYLA